MCGRYVTASPPEELARLLRAELVVPASEVLPMSWNVAPTDAVYAAAETRDGTRQLGTFRWGLVPSWSKDAKGGARMINLRSETLAAKFATTFERHRCLVPADGFYEWERRPDGTKQPWFIHRADGGPMAFAGLWESWRDPTGGGGDGERLRTCTIITTDANDEVARLHDRMPVVLEPDTWDAWLDRDITDLEALQPFLVPADPTVVTMHPVSPAVGNVRNNTPDLVLSTDRSVG